MKRAALYLASVSADCLAHVIQPASLVARPLVRLYRLARLRSACHGVIPVTTLFSGPVQTAGRVRLTCGPRCRLGRNVFFETGQDGGQILLGADVRINSGCVLVSCARIVIGDRSLIAEYVSIRDANHGTRLGTPIQDQPSVSARIIIGEDVWIGRGAAILKGVNIGSGAVIGANSVVTHDVPPQSVVAGVPARLLRMRGSTNAPSDNVPADPAARGEDVTRYVDA